MSDPTQVAQPTVDASDHVYSAAQKKVQDKSNDPRLAHSMAARVAASTIAAPAWVVAGIAAVLSTIGKAASVILDTFAAARKQGQPGLNALVASTLSDVLQLEVTPDQLAVGKGPDAARQTNKSIGQAFINTLISELAPGDVGSPEAAMAALESFLGFNMQFASSTALLGIFGELFSLGSVKDVGEIGDMMERALGLGRTARTAMHPVISNIIEKPLDHSMRAKYRQDLLGAAELIKAIFRGGPLASKASQLLAQHGLPDDQIAELTEQLRPHLSESELDTLVFQGEMTQPDAVAHIGNAGVPANIAQLRFRAITLQRLARLQEAGAGEVLSLIRDGKLPQSAMGEAMDTFDIPTLERDLWNKRAAVYATVRRRELGKGDIFFLYEHGQVTLDDVTQWATQEGYDPADILNIQLEAIVKAGGISNKTPDQIAAATKHLHNQHAAFVQDVFEGAYGRPASPAELAGWTLLLDTKQRTRADVKTEVKLNPTPPQQ